MKFTLSWLKEFLDTEASVAEIADGLTRVGIEVEEIVDRAKGLEAFRVARILETKQHPDADRLRVCQGRQPARRCWRSSAARITRAAGSRSCWRGPACTFRAST